jgi:prevent-host-death family protein
MRSLTATEAARRFSEVLDAVADRGESFVVMRRGRAVARIGPAASARGAHVKALLKSRPLDDAWTEELRELRSLVEAQERTWND